MWAEKGERARLVLMLTGGMRGQTREPARASLLHVKPETGPPFRSRCPSPRRVVETSPHFIKHCPGHTIVRVRLSRPHARLIIAWASSRKPSPRRGLSLARQAAASSTYATCAATISLRLCAFDAPVRAAQITTFAFPVLPKAPQTCITTHDHIHIRLSSLTVYPYLMKVGVRTRSYYCWKALSNMDSGASPILQTI